jgi:hypothetical protein
VKLDLPDEYVPVTTRALEQYAAYMKSTNRDDSLPLRALEVFRDAERKGPTKEEGGNVLRKKRA